MSRSCDQSRSGQKEHKMVFVVPSATIIASRSENQEWIVSE